jgi:hypothetical protein
MKKILSLLLALALFAGSTMAQSKKYFEGTIQFSFDFSGGGPEMEMAKAFMPTGYTFQVKGDNVRMRMNGGMGAMMGDMVVNGNKNKSFFLNDANKTAMTLPESKEEETPDAASFEVKKGTDERVIAGYKTQHYLITTREGEFSEMEFWVTDEIYMKPPQGKQGSPIGQASMYGIKGFPLRLVMASAGATVTMEVQSVKKEKLADSLFDIPKSYTTSVFNPAAMPMGGFDD